MKRNDFNVGQRFNYCGQTYKVTKKSGLPCARSIRIRVVERPDGCGGWFTLAELQKWADSGLIEFI